MICASVARQNTENAGKSRKTFELVAEKTKKTLGWASGAEPTLEAKMDTSGIEPDPSRISNAKRA